MKAWHIFFLLFLVACFKADPEPDSTETGDLPPSICKAPDPTDMTGAAVFGSGKPESCTQEALQSMIDVGGKIICNCGNTPFTLTLTSTLVVPNKEIIIDGVGLLTISGNNRVRIFDKQPANDQTSGTLFGLQNMKLINGKANLSENERGGGAIYGRAFGSMSIINVHFLNNEGPTSAADDCGAVHTILYKDVVFANCIFKGNKGANGGAVGTIGSAMTFINCVFEENEATGTGGTFAQGGSGGAVYVDGIHQNGTKNTMSLCGCSFKNNKAGYQAGALNTILYSGEGSSASVEKSSFENNAAMADKGGALYHMNGPLSVTNSIFGDNTSPAQGGGVWVSNTILSLANNTFKGNKALDNEKTGGLGGAVCIDGSGLNKAASIINCTFAENQAGNFASAIMNSGNLKLVNNLFQNNLTGEGSQSNPYGGATINKGSSLDVREGNIQYPKQYNGKYGDKDEDWLTPLVKIADVKLEPLGDNGGPTQTMAIPEGSEAINAGTKTGAPAIDQRGTARKENPDSGAFER